MSDGMSERSGEIVIKKQKEKGQEIIVENTTLFITKKQKKI